jgi:hypothetical protein
VAHLFSNSDSNSNCHTGAGHRVRSIPGVPWRVKAFGILAAVVVLLVVILHFTGHGFDSHTSAPAEHRMR